MQIHGLGPYGRSDSAGIVPHRHWNCNLDDDTWAWDLEHYSGFRPWWNGFQWIGECVHRRNLDALRFSFGAYSRTRSGDWGNRRIPTKRAMG